MRRLLKDRPAIPPTALRPTTANLRAHRRPASPETSLPLDEPAHPRARLRAGPRAHRPHRLGSQQELLAGRPAVEYTTCLV
jgi:hypothetical protein